MGRHGALRRSSPAASVLGAGATALTIASLLAIAQPTVLPAANAGGAAARPAGAQPTPAMDFQLAAGPLQIPSIGVVAPGFDAWYTSGPGPSLFSPTATPRAPVTSSARKPLPASDPSPSSLPVAPVVGEEPAAPDPATAAPTAAPTAAAAESPAAGPVVATDTPTDTPTEPTAATPTTAPSIPTPTTPTLVPGATLTDAEPPAPPPSATCDPGTPDAGATTTTPPADPTTPAAPTAGAGQETPEPPPTVSCPPDPGCPAGETSADAGAATDPGAGDNTTPPTTCTPDPARTQTDPPKAAGTTPAVGR